MPVNEQEFRKRIKKLKAKLPKYEKLARSLRAVLEKASELYAPQAVVHVRAKPLASAAEKVIRKDYDDPLRQMTDLCGGRMVTNTPAEVDRMCSFIREHFEVDEENSPDVASRLRENEFGYLSVHFVVQLRPGVFPTRDVPVKIPRLLLDQDPPLKAEIQVRTLLQHAWAVVGHDRIYKSPFEVPRKWKRESARLAAALEQADSSIAAMIKGLDAYQTSYGAYLTPEKMKEEIKILKIVLEHDPDNSRLAHRIGKLAMCLGEWSLAVRVFNSCKASKSQPLLRDLGVALCKKHKKRKRSPAYQRGQKLLASSIALDGRDADAISALAGTYKGINKARVLDIYGQAFEIDPTDPYPLGCYIEQRVAAERSLAVVSALRPSLRGAIARCREQADIGINLPWAMYDTGKFHLLLGQPYESLAAYAKAVQLSSSEDMIDTSLASVESMSAIAHELPELEWVRRLLLVAKAARLPKRKITPVLAEIASKRRKKLSGPVVMVAGGCDPAIERAMTGYRELLMSAFAGFRGTVVCGGTKAGVSGLVGDIGERHPTTVETVGYAPRRLPRSVNLDKMPKRYRQIRRTHGTEFTPLEPLQAWIDLIASGVNPKDVKLIGIGGGQIAGFEYRLALALGAKVAVLDGSGRAAAALTIDPDWGSLQGLVRMPRDMMTLKTFVECDVPAADPQTRETLGRAIHAKYQKNQAREAAKSQKSRADWDKLPETLKNSNLQQADDIERKLQAIGCTMREVTDREITRMTFTKQEIETMAEMEHARWSLERLLDGWTPGAPGTEKDVDKKISPHLVRWSKLPDDVKKWDHAAVAAIPELLANIGLEICREP